jgi:hypothetical protein
VPHRIATGIIDLVAVDNTAWMLRRDGKVVATGEIKFPAAGTGHHVMSNATDTSYDYALHPVVAPIPGPVRRLLPSEGGCCAELASGSSGCLVGKKWVPTPSRERGDAGPP